MNKKIIIIIAFLFFFPIVGNTATYYVDYADGSDDNWSEGNGYCTDSEKPCKYLNHPNYSASDGDTIYIRGGTTEETINAHTYYIGDSAQANNAGSYGYPQGVKPEVGHDGLTYSAYPGETVKFVGTHRRSVGIKLISTDNTTITGITGTGLRFTNVGNGFLMSGGCHYNEIKYCLFDGQGAPLSGGTGTHSGSNDASVLTHADDGTASDHWKNYVIHNLTDYSFGTVTASTSTTITATMTKGTENLWDTNDSYELIYDVGNFGNGIHDSSTHNWIHHCTISNWGGYYGNPSTFTDAVIGFQIGNVNGGSDEQNNYNTIENNNMYAGGHHVFGIDTGKYNVIRDNYIHNEAWYTKMGCEAKTDGKCGYRVASDGPCTEGYCGYNLYEGNKIAYGAAYGGPHLGTGGSGSGYSLATDGNLYRYNEHFYNALYAIRLYNSITGQDSNYNRIYNNTFYKNGYGSEDDTYHTDYYQNHIQLSSDSCTTRDNAVVNNLLYDCYIYPLNNDYTPIRLYSAEACCSKNFGGADDTTDPKFTDPDITDPTSTALPDLSLQSDSTAIDGGTYLTTVSSVTDSDTIVVDDAQYFQDGTWGSSLASIDADYICLSSDTTVDSGDSYVQIDSIDYDNKIINTTTAHGASGGWYVYLYKKSDGDVVLSGTAPDYGAYEFTGEASPSGTVVTGGFTEAQIRAGGGIIYIDLTGTTWNDPLTNDMQDAICDGIDSAQSEGTGWDAVVTGTLDNEDVTRTSDTRVTITLPAFAGYDITVKETITVTIPSTCVASATQIVASPTFDISPVSGATITHVFSGSGGQGSYGN